MKGELKTVAQGDTFGPKRAHFAIIKACEHRYRVGYFSEGKYYFINNGDKIVETPDREGKLFVKVTSIAGEEVKREEKITIKLDGKKAIYDKESKEEDMKVLPPAEIELKNVQTAASNNAKPVVKNSCVICMTKPSDHIVVPCGHQCVCEDCAKSVKGPQADRKSVV